MTAAEARSDIGRRTVIYANRGLHARLVESLGARIVCGEINPGDIIDLDALGQERSVSRTVVRGAVKVLMGKGLLDARPKYGTFVRGRNEWNLLDPDVIRWRQSAGPDSRLLRELEEIRQIIEPVTARLAAERADQQHLDALEAAMTTLAGAASRDVHVDADLQFHRTLASASGNELLERLVMMLEPAQRMRDQIAFEGGVDHHESIAAHKAVLDCVCAHDPNAAEGAMRILLEAASRDVEALITPHPEIG